MVLNSGHTSGHWNCRSALSSLEPWRQTGARRLGLCRGAPERGGAELSASAGGRFTPSAGGRFTPSRGQVHAFAGAGSRRGDDLGHPEQAGGLGRSRVGGGSAWARAGPDGARRQTRALPPSVYGSERWNS
jgi:hypothetical protein